MAAKAYEVLKGLSYPSKNGEKRVKPGDVVRDIPAPSIKWLLESGAIKLQKESTK